MSTKVNTQKDILQVFGTFAHFINLYENDSWLKYIKTEDVVTFFKCAALVEKTIQQTESNNSCDGFLESFTFWLKNVKNKSVNYSLEFYNVACDHLLTKFFTSKFVSTNCVDIAIRMYVAVNTQQRLETVISSMLLTSASYDVILDYVLINKKSIDLIHLEVKLLFDSFLNDYCHQNIDKLKNTVDSMLSSYKIESCLCLLIKILSLKSNKDLELKVQQIILEKLKPKMIDRSILSQQFWYNLLKMNMKNVIDVCKNHREFLSLFFNFIVYLVTMLNFEDDSWVIDENAVCTKITYNDLLKILQEMYDDEDLKNFVKTSILDAKNAIDTPIWTDIEKKICL